MAELYGTTRQNISLNIKGSYADGEHSPEATVKKHLTVRSEGGRAVSRAFGLLQPRNDHRGGLPRQVNGDEATEAGFSNDLEAAVKLLESGKKTARHSRG